MDTPLDIVIGGAGDRLFGCARAFADAHRAAHPGREVVYLPQGRRPALRSLVEARPGVNLIGHSWGAADASWAARVTGQTLGALIGVDGVGKPGRWRPYRPTARVVVSVRGTGSEGRISDGNLTAWMGRGIGHAFPEGFRCEGCVRIDAPFAHYDMVRMMAWPGVDGRSALDWLLECSGTPEPLVS